jgi:hypothetical protein
VRQVARRNEIRYACRIVRNPKEIQPSGRHGLRWTDNIKMHLKYSLRVSLDSTDWSHCFSLDLLQERDEHNI